MSRITRPAEVLTWTIPEFAAVIGVHESTMRAMIKRGDVPALRIGRRVLISRKRGAEWIEANGDATFGGQGRTALT